MPRTGCVKDITNFTGWARGEAGSSLHATSRLASQKNITRVTDTVMDTLRTLFREIVSQSFLFESWTKYSRSMPFLGMCEEGMHISLVRQWTKIYWHPSKIFRTKPTVMGTRTTVMARPVHSYGHRPGKLLNETETMSGMVKDCEEGLRGRVVV